MEVRAGIRASAFLIGFGAAWNAGNIGPIVGSLVEDFGVSLSVVGLLSGSVFCVGVVSAGFAGAPLSERLSPIQGLRLCCLVCLIGNLLAALSPVFGGLLVARLLTGFGLGLAFLFGGVFARAEGGDKLVGLFGAGIQLGVAFALVFGGFLEDADVDWRITFVISALVGVSALPFLPRTSAARAAKHEPIGELLREATTSSRFWRLEMVAVAAFAIPIVIGAWLVHYLVIEGDLTSSVAGLVAFALFGISAWARDYGGILLARGARHGALSLGGLVAGAAGLVVLAVEPSLGGALIAVVLIGVGLSLPYAVVYNEGVRVIPESPAGGLGLVQAIGNSFPIPVTPLLGAALASGDGTLGWMAIAAFVLIAGLANARPAVPPVSEPATASSADPG